MNNNKLSNTLKSYNCKKLKGNIFPPADKSISHRALLISALAIGKSCISNLLEAEDIMNMINALRLLGVKLEKRKNGDWIVIGNGLNGFSKPVSIIDCGNSGTLVRILIGAISSSDISVTFSGDKSLSKRPMDRIITPLQKMGVRFVTNDDKKLPLTVIGSTNLLPISYESPIPSAQIKTSILLAALNVRGKSEIKEDFCSRDHTERLLKYYGSKICFNSKKTKNYTVCIEGGTNLKSNDIFVPSDISSASFAIVGATIIPGSKITLKNVGINQTRSGILEALKKMGAKITIDKKILKKCSEPVADIKVEYSKLNGVDINQEFSVRMIDEYPILSMAAAVASGKSIFRGLKELKIKESNRFNAIIDGLKACKVKIDYEKDAIIIYGSADGVEGDATIDSNFDHRIAMSFLILGSISKRPIKVNGCESILTSYPNFLEQMNSLGMDIRSYE